MPSEDAELAHGSMVCSKGQAWLSKSACLTSKLLHTQCTRTGTRAHTHTRTRIHPSSFGTSLDEADQQVALESPWWDFGFPASLSRAGTNQGWGFVLPQGSVQPARRRKAMGGVRDVLVQLTPSSHTASWSLLPGGSPSNPTQSFLRVPQNLLYTRSFWAGSFWTRTGPGAPAMCLAND